jgi:hypothetical protein
LPRGGRTKHQEGNHYITPGSGTRKQVDTVPLHKNEQEEEFGSIGCITMVITLLWAKKDKKDKNVVFDSIVKRFSHDPRTDALHQIFNQDHLRD